MKGIKLNMDIGAMGEVRCKAFLSIVAHLVSIAQLLGLGGFNGVAAGPNNNNNNKVTRALALFLLGDSSVDCGLNTMFYPLLHRNFSLLPCHSNASTLLPNLLADNIGAQHPQPFYTQNGSIEAILSGLNFGSPQATIMSSPQISYQSLNQQLRQALDTIQLLRLRLALNTAPHFIQSSLFYLSFGQVDFINLYILNSSTAVAKNFKYHGQEFARLLVSQMSFAIRNLHEAGARKIVCMGILPLGCTPRVLSQWRQSPRSVYDENGCVRGMNELVVKYNDLMEKRIVMMNEQFGDARMVFCDVYKGIMEIIAKPQKYGFEESKIACCGLGWYNASIGCLATEIACSHVGRHVWWDLYNPTGHVNSLLADSAWRNSPFSTFCRPSTVQDLLK